MLNSELYLETFINLIVIIVVLYYISKLMKCLLVDEEMQFSTYNSVSFQYK